MWFDNWSDIVRVVLVGAAAYGSLMLVLRFSGKRTLAKLNAFDFVVTVALGSTLATILLNSSVSWSEGVTALLALAVFQFLVAGASAWIPGARSLVTGSPTLLVRSGATIPSAMRDQRVTDADVRQAVRQAGLGDLGRVAAVVLETDGSLSVITADAAGSGWALEDLR